MYLSSSQIQQLEKRYRANLINSLSGYKSANLIATKSQDAIENVAIFSSVIHLGSKPPLLGFILRPTSATRNTWDNINTSSFFSVNHVNQKIYKQAHHTSARYDGTTSEFKKTQLTPEYKNNFFAPFVKESPIQIGCKMLNNYYIEENECRLIVAEIKQLYLSEKPAKDGWLDLSKHDTLSINGLDAYTLPTLLDRLAYAKPNEETRSLLDE
ncbi:flavin reductase family protein [Haloflavibacter putidus]|uniref:Flavin oxidoreductase n=1 Tax=Haloflavibacter putidus TaxID=2576776 RepID=A0A507ZVP2_9FLAO|nr:flavin reductase [Haloflavibacter putidus]TQD38845.1 flavin oxidoreductase [Haloflavibacter putidus]